ncbi:MAG TPA: CheR family methyltransferase, partial [Rubricoccaceae bacterium]
MPDASTPSDPSGDGAPAAEAALAPGAETAPVTPEEAPDDPYADTPDDELLVVGLGASAGGVEALERFFSALPDMPGAAFVVVLHLSPDHESHLAEVLQRATAMPVQQVRRAVRTEANHVYVIPPNRSLSMADGTLELSAYADDGERRAPIDLFFRTLGTEHRRCAAVVLSGTGADGSVGIKRVHEAGGLVLAQEPMDAAYDAMPLNAVETGLVDAVGTAEALARRVAAFVDSTAVVRLPDGAPESDTEALVQLLASLRARTGHDFAHYKRATVMRRIARRMHVHSLASLTEYASLVRSSTDEAAALLQDLLISVTNFFRDPAAWKALAETVVPQLFEGKGPGDTIRVWSAACATGEEAYSLAMLLAEHAATLERPPAFQVFASDIDEDSLARAREGRYSEAIVADVSAERLARFFNPEHGHFCVRKEIRERVLFSSHSLIKDPPFSRLDLIACRNLLIYLQREVQVRVFELFHYALAPGGVLFLGSSEAADVVDDLYRPLDGSQRIFQRRASARAAAMLPRMPLQPARVAPQRAARGPGGRVITPRSTGAVAADLHQRLLEAYAPPSAVVDERHEIVHLSETAGRFLRFSGGVPSTNIVQAVAPELQLELRLALHRAFQQGKSTSGGPIRVNVGGEETHVHLIVRPGVPDGTDEALALVIFTEVEAEPAPAGRTGDPPTDALVAGLEAELDRTRERLQLTVEEHETIVEELRASNEELQSVNEEYRSATEELETSREELQSVNEELVTVNNELTAHVDEVTRVHSDLQHLMSSTEIGTLFVDRDLRVQRYTPRVARLFNVVAGDRGRPLAHVTHRLHDIDLTADAAGVLASLVPAEREVRTHDGETYLVRIRPYRTVDDRIEGVVLTFVDITARVEAETALRESEEQRRLAMEAAAMGTFVWPIGGETVEADARLRAVFGLPPGTDPLPTADFRALIHPDDVPQLAAVRDAAETEGAHTGVDFRVVQPTGEVRHVEVRSRTFGEGDGRRSVGLVLDVTERVRADEALRASEARLRLATESGGVAVGIWDFVTGRVTGDARLAFLYGLDEAEVTSPEGTDSAALFARIHPEDLPAVEAASAREIETGAGGYSVEYRALGADGVWRSLLIHAAVERSPEGEPVRFAGAILDVTERVAAEEALRASEVRFRTLFETIDEGFALCEMITDDAGEPVSYRFLDTNPAFRAMTGLDVIGKTVHEVLPDEAEAWIAHFAPVALGGETVRFEQAANAIGQTFSVYASPAEPTGSGRFTQVFSDVTVQRRAAEALEADARRSGYRVALADALRLLSDPREVQGAAARVLGEYLGAMRVHYAEVEPDDVHAVVADEYVQDAAPATGRHRLDDFGPTLNEAYRAGQGRAVPDVEAEASLAEPERAAYRALGIAALVAVPLVKNGRLAALLVVHQRTPTAWTPDEIALIEETAERTWAASERARAETAARTQAARVAFLAETAASLLRGVDPEALLRDLAGPLAALVGMEAFTHYTADGDSLRLVTAEGFDPAAVAQNGHRAIGTGLSGRAAELRAPVVENDVQSSESPETAIARSLGLAAYGAFPLVAEGRLLGTVSLGTRGAARFDDGALDVVRAVCDYVAVAVAAAEAARHLAESETRYRMLFTSIDEGFALCEIVTDEAGVPVDYRFIEVNPAFFAMTGLPAGAAGQTARALIPDLEDHWIERYARAALGGETMRFVEGSAAMGRVFDVFAAPADTPGRFTAVFTDITARSMAEAALQSEARRAAYRVTLSDALRPLATPAAVHSTATRLLGEHLGASRVYSGAVSADGKDVTLGPDYHDGVPSAAGVHRLGAFGARLADGLREGRTMAASHVSADRSLSARELKTYAALGVEAYIGVPILRDGRLVGVLGTHHSTPRVWTPAEIALVEETAERTWNAAETARAEAAVRESEARARLALDIAAIGSWTWEPADDTMTPDARTGEICGIPSGRPLPVADVLARVHGDDRPRI